MALALNNALLVARIPKRPLDSFTWLSCFHISDAVVAPLMWIISASLMANSIRVRALASPLRHFSLASFSSSVGSPLLVYLHLLQYIFPVQGLATPQAF